MDPIYINKETIASMLPMSECIDVMETMFCSLANGECMQPLRSLMWLPDKSGLLGMMPGFAPSLDVMGIKVISVFHGNRDANLPSHQGVVMLFDARHGEPLAIFDALEITAIRTAAASAVATRILSRQDSESLAIIGSGEQAKRHLESMSLVRKIKHVNVWSRNRQHAEEFVANMSDNYEIPIELKSDVQQAVHNADIICVVTSSSQPVLCGKWISPGTHINAIGSATPSTRELDTECVAQSKLYTDCYDSIFNEAGDFLIAKKEGAITDNHVRGEIGEVLLGRKTGRESEKEITIFKSLGIAVEDIFSAYHIYKKIKQQ